MGCLWLKRTLLLGNGLNRCLPGASDWNDLLTYEEPAKFSGDDNAHIPSNLLFECIAAENGRRQFGRGRIDYDALKQQKIGKALASLESNINTNCGTIPNLHRMFAGLPYDSVVTTNYDTLFERAHSCEVIPETINTQSRYLLGPTGHCGDKLFYHAHGIESSPKSLVLGYEHYQRLAIEIARKLGLTNRDHDGYQQLADEVASHNEPCVLAWPYLILFAQVDIVGFGLGFAETDFWWLLTLRASLLNQFKYLEYGAINYYYVTIDEEKRAIENNAIINALDMLSVKCVPVHAESYEKGYEQIWKSICDSFNKTVDKVTT